jgi:molybdopterin-guanine dinucleotide biosynthesis protein A
MEHAEMPNLEEKECHLPATTAGRVGGVILAGGHSRRMGCDKAELRLESETFLQRICRVLSGHFQPLVVVCRPDQAVGFRELLTGPSFLPPPIVITDQHPERGPLEGLATALEFLAGQAIPLAGVTTCDAPLIQPTLLYWLAEQLETGHDAVMPSDDQHLYGLTAVYRTEAGTTLRQLLEQGERRIIDLPRQIAVRIVTWDACRAADPQLLSFLNANTPEEYRVVCQRSAAES